MVDVSIIIVSFNTKDLLLSCVNSVVKHTRGVSWEIIVIDNGSTDGSAEGLKSKKIKLITNKENAGFAHGSNQGIGEAKGRYILLLNSDTEFVENTLLKMVDFMDKNKKVGISSCKLLNKDGTTQATGGFFPNLVRVFLWSTFLDDIPFLNFQSYHPSPNSAFYKTSHEQDWVTGAFFLMGQDVVKSVGYIDENFFMYVEELEYCFRAKKLGWKVFYNSETAIIHIGGASGARANPILGEFKGLKLFYKKHNSWISRLLLNLCLKLAAVLRILVFGLIKPKKGAASAYVRAFIEN